MTLHFSISNGYPQPFWVSFWQQLTDDDLAYFKSILAPSALTQDEGDLEAFNNDWLQKYRGQSKLVLKPSTTEQVSQILKYCNDNK